MDIAPHEEISTIRFLIENDEFKPVHFTTLTYQTHIRERGFRHYCQYLRKTAQDNEIHIKVWASRGADAHLHLIIATIDGKSIKLPTWEYGDSLTKPYHDGVADYLFNKHGHDALWFEDDGRGRIFCPQTHGCKRRCVYWD